MVLRCKLCYYLYSPTSRVMLLNLWWRLKVIWCVTGQRKFNKINIKRFINLAKYSSISKIKSIPLLSLSTLSPSSSLNVTMNRLGPIGHQPKKKLTKCVLTLLNSIIPIDHQHLFFFDTIDMYSRHLHYLLWS